MQKETKKIRMVEKGGTFEKKSTPYLGTYDTDYPIHGLWRITSTIWNKLCPKFRTDTNNSFLIIQRRTYWDMGLLKIKPHVWSFHTGTNKDEYSINDEDWKEQIKITSLFADEKTKKNGEIQLHVLTREDERIIACSPRSVFNYKKLKTDPNSPVKVFASRFKSASGNVCNMLFVLLDFGDFSLNDPVKVLNNPKKYIKEVNPEINKSLLFSLLSATK